MPHDTVPIPGNAGTVAGATPGTDPLYTLSLKGYLRAFAREGFAFWMICGYLFVEYVRPQSIVSGLDFLPWGQIFLILALVGIFFDKQRGWVSDPVNKYLLLFFVVILLSCMMAVYPNESWG